MNPSRPGSADISTIAGYVALPEGDRFVVTYDRGGGTTESIAGEVTHLGVQRLILVTNSNGAYHTGEILERLRFSIPHQPHEILTYGSVVGPSVDHGEKTELEVSFPLGDAERLLVESYLGKFRSGPASDVSEEEPPSPEKTNKRADRSYSILTTRESLPGLLKEIEERRCVQVSHQLFSKGGQRAEVIIRMPYDAMQQARLYGTITSGWIHDTVSVPGVDERNAEGINRMRVAAARIPKV